MTETGVSTKSKVGQASSEPMQMEKSLLQRLKNASPQICAILSRSRSLEEARRRLYQFLDSQQRALEMGFKETQYLERANIRECLAVFRNILAKRNEKVTGVSSLYYLYHLIRGDDVEVLQSVTEDFVEDLIHLFRGISGQSGIYDHGTVVYVFFSLHPKSS